MVGDAATSNVKCMKHLLPWLQEQGKRWNLVVSGVFMPCLLHQLSRLIIMDLDRSDLSTPLFSITRLTQHSVLRDKVFESLEKELRARLRRKTCFPPADVESCSADFRRQLNQILLGRWQENGAVSAAEQRVLDMFSFFNGDITQEGEWEHYCNGCCGNDQIAMSKAA